MVEYNGGFHDTTTWQITDAAQLFVDGPKSGLTDEPYSFTADAVYFLGMDIVTHTWEIEGHDPITIVNGLTSTVEVSWPLTGTKKMTVTAMTGPDDIFGQQKIVGQHQIIIGLPPLFLPAVFRDD